MTDKELQDKVRGSLVGGAVGDALGYPVEFMSYDQIVGKYGEKGITRYQLSPNGVAEISDDTQMTLFTANGHLINDIPAAYLEWLDTQSWAGKPDNHACKCWISKIPQLYSRRAPGNTCLSALHCMAKEQEAKNDSKGCGGIMRVAPIALYNVAHGIDPWETCRQACEAAKLTHKHPMGWMSAGIFAIALHNQIIDDTMDPWQIAFNFEDGLNVVTDIFPFEQADYDEMLRGLRLAAKLAFDNLNDEDGPDEPNIKQLGEGWTGEEALYIASYCCIKHFDDTAKAIIAAVNHGGDSDSTGAIAGNFMGAIHGYSAIPDYFKDNLELRDVIETMADDLYSGKISH